MKQKYNLSLNKNSTRNLRQKWLKWLKALGQQATAVVTGNQSESEIMVTSSYR